MRGVDEFYYLFMLSIKCNEKGISHEPNGIQAYMKGTPISNRPSAYLEYRQELIRIKHTLVLLS